MVAVQGVTVSADLPGTVERIHFESGKAVRQGDVLAVLDTRQEQAQLAALEAQRELARITFERMQGLLNERVISQAELDRATADFRQTDARVGEVRAVIERKKIRAPFSGILGLRQVNLGQYPGRRRRIGHAAIAQPHLRQLRRASASGQPSRRWPHGPHHDRRREWCSVDGPSHGHRLEGG